MSDYFKLLIKIFLLAVVVLASTAEARNPNISSWIKNLSFTTTLEPSGVYWKDEYSNIAVSGNTVHALWFGTKFDYSDHQFVYRRSLDNGSIWGSPKIIARDSDISGSDLRMYSMENSRNLCVVGSTVHIVVVRANPSGYRTLEYYRSSDNGSTFAGRRTLFTGGAGWNLVIPRIVCNAQRVVIASSYYYTQPDQSSIKLLISENAGKTFRSTQAASANSVLSFEDLALSGTDIHVLYTLPLTGYNQKKMALASSRDDGHTFTSQVMSTTPAPDGGYYAQSTKDIYNSPDLVVDGTNVHVLWTQVDNGYYHSYGGKASLWYARSLNRGQNFIRKNIYQLTLQDVNDRSHALAIGQETLAVKGNYVYIAILTKDGTIRLRRSTDAGLTFQTTQRLGGGWWPEFGIDPSDQTGASVFLFWDAPTYRYSSNGGQTFSKELWAFPAYSSSSYIRSQHRVGSNGRLHITSGAHFYSASLCGGLCDDDVVYRRVQTVPTPPSESLTGLRIFTGGQGPETRADNFQAHAKTVNFTTAMTAECWVKDMGGGNTTGTTSGWSPVISKERELTASSTWKPAYSLGTFDYYGKRKILTRLMTTAGEQELSATGDQGLLPLTTWTHLAVTYNAAQSVNNLKLYKNGSLIAQSTISGNLSPGVGNLFIGRYGNWVIDEVRLWSIARTPTQIKGNMYKPLTGQETGLAAYYNFNKTIKDITGKGNDGLLMYKETYAPGKY